MDLIPQVEPLISEAEIQAIADYLRSGGWLTEFKKTEEFEEMLADFLGVSHAVVVTSGTAALYLSFLALGIGQGDSVIVPDYTMIATPNSVKWTGAEVILCDVEQETLCLDLKKVKLKDNTKGLVYVAINGRAGDMDEVTRFCKDSGLYLVEDACQAFGSKWNGKFLGTFGDAGVISFTPHKIITTGQGGAVITNDDEVFKRVKKLKDFCRAEPGVDIHDDIGFNFKFTDLQAVLGIEQLKTIDFRISRKKDIYQTYKERLSGLPFLEFLPLDLDQMVPWFVDIILKGIPKEKFISYLKKNGIGSREFYPPIHTQEPYSHLEGSFAVSSKIAPNGVWLPSSLKLRTDEIEYIAQVIQKFF